MQHWIFQAVIEQFDLQRPGNVEVGKTDSWKATGHSKSMSPGDIVFFWQAGPKEVRGIYARGEITSPAARKDGETRVDVVYREKLRRPILATEIRRHSELESLEIFRIPRGTNFPLTDRQASRLYAMIDERGREFTIRPGTTKSAIDQQLFEEHVLRYLDVSTQIAQRHPDKRGWVDPSILLIAITNNTFASTLATEEGPIDFFLSYALVETKAWADYNNAFRLRIGIDPGHIDRRHVLKRSFGPFNPAAMDILDDAVAIGHQVSDGVAGIRHFIAALLVTDEGKPRGAITDILAGFGLDPARLRGEYLELVLETYPEDRADAWRALLSSGASRPAGLQLTTLRADTIGRDARDLDCLGLGPFADGLGAIIASSQQMPPLAVAVFGPWGAGKSFFMRMVEGAIGEFSKSGLLAQDGRPAFKGRIAHIWFNAWHYAEGNLWASLMHAILDGLRQAMTPDPTEEEKFEKAMEKLRSAKDTSAAVETELATATANVRAAQAALVEAEKAANEAKTAVQDVPTATQALRAVWSMTLEELGPTDPATATAWVRSLSTNGKQVAEYLGRPDLVDKLGTIERAAETDAGALDVLTCDVSSFRELLDEVEIERRRGSSALLWLSRIRVTRREGIFLAGICLMIFVVFLGAGWLLEASGLKILPVIVEVGAFAAPLATALTMIAGWIRRNLGRASEAVSVVERLRLRVEQKQSGAVALNARTLEEAREKASAAQAEEVRRAADLEAARAAELIAKARVAEAAPGARLMTYVSKRLADGDYQRQLGLVHTVRNDIERLEGILKSIAPPMPVAEGARDGTPPERNSIERIVLYIDDLDRCEPARVVQVLEAVHLILATPLFVAVVGVDIRWVSQALLTQYPHLLGHEKGKASPIDYLEKIFQIPFWLQPMGAEDGQNLLRSAIEADLAPVVDAPRRDGPESDDGPGTTGKTNQNESKPLLPSGEGPGKSGRPDEQDAPAVVAALTFNQAEQTAIAALATVIGTSPRRHHRFVNLYRLFKISRLQQRGAEGDVLAPLLILAISTGAPRAAQRLFAALDVEQPAVSWRRMNDAAVIAAPDDERVSYGAFLSHISGSENRDAILTGVVQWLPAMRRFMFEPGA